MTEQPNPSEPQPDEGSHASVGNPDVGRAGGGRTEGETRVDDEMGTGPAEPQ